MKLSSLFAIAISIALTSCATSKDKLTSQNLGLSYSQVENVKILSKRIEIEHQLGLPDNIVEYPDEPNNVYLNYNLKTMNSPRATFVVSKSDGILQRKWFYVHDDNVTVDDLFQKYRGNKFESLIKPQTSHMIPNEIKYGNKKSGIVFLANRWTKKVMSIGWLKSDSITTYTTQR